MPGYDEPCRARRDSCKEAARRSVFEVSSKGKVGHEEASYSVAAITLAPGCCRLSHERGTPTQYSQLRTWSINARPAPSSLPLRSACGIKRPPWPRGNDITILVAACHRQQARGRPCAFRLAATYPAPMQSPASVSGGHAASLHIRGSALTTLAATSGRCLTTQSPKRVALARERPG